MLSFNYITDKHLSTVTFSAKDIGKIIQNLDSKKPHGQDNISIGMLKICGDSIYVPLEMIFQQAIFTGVLPSEGKKRNIVLINKKSDEQNIKNYRPVSLLPICGKIFERLFLTKCLSISPLINSSLKTDSCINQLLPITRKFFASLDNALEVRSVS